MPKSYDNSSQYESENKINIKQKMQNFPFSVYNPGSIKETLHVS